MDTELTLISAAEAVFCSSKDVHALLFCVILCNEALCRYTHDCRNNRRRRNQCRTADIPDMSSVPRREQAIQIQEAEPISRRGAHSRAPQAHSRARRRERPSARARRAPLRRGSPHSRPVRPDRFRPIPCRGSRSAKARSRFRADLRPQTARQDPDPPRAVRLRRGRRVQARLPQGRLPVARASRAASREDPGNMALPRRRESPPQRPRQEARTLRNGGPRPAEAADTAIPARRTTLAECRR